MDIPFIYSKYVIGKNYIGREQESMILGNLLTQGENVAIYEPPKTGQTSLLQQSFLRLKSSGTEFTAVSVSLFDIRSIRALTLRLGSELIRSCGAAPDEYAKAVERFLPGTHFMFDPKRHEADGSILSLGWDVDNADIEAVFTLPYRIAATCGKRVFVLLKEFQNIMLTEDGDMLCNMLYKIFDGRDTAHSDGVSYIFTGTQTNAMHDIFGVRKLFYRQVERVKIEAIDTRLIIDHVTRGFLATGKVIDRDLLLGVCKLFRNDIHYINLFASICDSLTRGYIMEPVLNEALEAIISIHEPRFMAIMNDLTTFQVNLLNAILRGHTKFTSSEVISEFALSSSANVRRLKDALVKKEIVSFDEDGKPTVLDPLFEYWAKNFYYRIES